MWVAYFRADVAEIEELRIALERRREIGRRFVLLRWEQPRFGHGKPELLHGAVRRLLFHRLDGPRVVQHVEAFHENGLFYPLTASVVPVRDPIENDVVTGARFQTERLDTHTLDFEAHRFTLNREGRVPPSENLFEADKANRDPPRARDQSGAWSLAAHRISIRHPLALAPALARPVPTCVVTALQSGSGC